MPQAGEKCLYTAIVSLLTKDVDYIVLISMSIIKHTRRSMIRRKLITYKMTKLSMSCSPAHDCRIEVARSHIDSLVLMKNVMSREFWLEELNLLKKLYYNIGLCQYYRNAVKN